MTDQSKTTIDMPDELWFRDTMQPCRAGMKNSFKYIRVDLVPAAPTSDKAEAISFAIEAIRRNLVKFNYVDEVILLEAMEKLQSLQENTAPDDLIKALDEIVIRAKRAMREGMDNHEDIYDVAKEALAAYKAKTQGAV